MLRVVLFSFILLDSILKIRSSPQQKASDVSKIGLAVSSSGFYPNKNVSTRNDNVIIVLLSLSCRVIKAVYSAQSPKNNSASLNAGTSAMLNTTPFRAFPLTRLKLPEGSWLTTRYYYSKFRSLCRNEMDSSTEVFLQIKIAFCVPIADVFNDAANPLQVVRDIAFLDVLSEQVAQ